MLIRSWPMAWPVPQATQESDFRQVRLPSSGVRPGVDLREAFAQLLHDPLQAPYFLLLWTKAQQLFELPKNDHFILFSTRCPLLIFVLFPPVVWTGLAMSWGVVSAVPVAVTLLGGQQSAWTRHFFVSAALALFVAVDVAMVRVGEIAKRAVIISLVFR